MVGEPSSTTTTVLVGTGCAMVVVLVQVGLRAWTCGPVRMLLGRSCSKPWSRATFSMDLKYCVISRQ